MANANVSVRALQKELCCPRCGAKEVKDNTLPIDQWVFQIKAYRVDNWSKCLICEAAGINDCWFDDDGNQAS